MSSVEKNEPALLGLISARGSIKPKKGVKEQLLALNTEPEPKIGLTESTTSILKCPLTV